ncbi:MAG TPA: D-alanyl-D-alanine carboxypeptidase/D-alanyl-D-alanine-endopeptidase [Mycobacteriales bacterium]|nr:D-alanyl-D-alanine carboxypeptidase/D-alanyl-D-alanine-endopeptidase [Mycobacteriales bacterium]
MRTAARAALAVAVLAAAAGGVAVGMSARDEPTVRRPVPVAAAPTTEPTRSPLLPSRRDSPLPTPAGLAAALTTALADPALGPSVSAVVLDATTGASLLDLRGSTPVVPASTAKIATGVAVLAGLPPETRLRTQALAGPLPGDVVLVGGGDVTLAGPATPPATGPPGARLTDLAAQTRTALGATPVQRVLVDDTAYAPPATGPSWKPSYLVTDVAPVQALSMDGGRAAPGRDERVADPALATGRAFARLLAAPAAAVVRAPAPAGAALLGAVDSAPLPDLVEQMLTASDNDLAESLGHRLALARGLPGTFAGAAQATRDVLADLVPAGGVTLADASGLSVENRVQPAAVAALLATVAGDRSGRYGAVLSGLPVAGFDGTLEARYRAGATVPAAGQVRAKTGTLLGVSALAGLVRTADGRLLAFDVTLNAVPSGATRAAEAALDRVATVLAGCGCR